MGYKGTWDDIATCTWDTRIRGYRAYVGYKYTRGDTMIQGYKDSYLIGIRGYVRYKDMWDTSRGYKGYKKDTGDLAVTLRLLHTRR